jgi:tetratricopeptide (TPR) repeat protein
MLNNIGWMRAQLGDHEGALALCQQALAVQQEIGDSASAAHTWDSLGYAHRCLGRYDEALACYRRAIDLFMEPGGVPRDAAMTWTCLGDTRHEAGDLSGAREAWQRALEILDELGDAGADGVRTKLKTS